MLASRGHNPGQLQLDDDMAAVAHDRHKAFADRFNRAYKDSADLTQWDHEQLRTLHLGGITHNDTNAESGRLVSLRGVISTVGKTSAEMQLAKGAGIARLEFGQQDLGLKLLLLRVGQGVCDVKASEVCYSHQSRKLIKYFAIDVCAVLRFDIKDVLVQFAAIADSLEKQMLESWPDGPPMRYLDDAATPLVEAVCGIGQVAQSGQDCKPKEKPVANLSGAKDALGRLNRHNSKTNLPAGARPRRSRKMRQPL